MENEKDLYRDTLVRYLGYANEVGESFRNLVSKNVVRGSYVVATGYAVADTVDKTYKDFKQSSSVSSAGITAVDVFLWQMLASVSIPGFTINRITYFSGQLLRKVNAKKSIVKFLPVAIGLSSIPFIIHPIDHFTDYLMDNTYRKFFKKN
ncbi:mitochondrial fission process protein 1 [Lucilia cuprina]|uniref:mitochondrial fission process protein 1 n=1 Tax=Lucilia cuprina TaxID=7375 RepID=UPI000C71C6BC|nr:mitochondrial fission process protein 1 [Lucilia cuprina]